MKKFKKIASLLLALVMVCAMSVTAFAEDSGYSITISNSVDGETYSFYKIFDAVYNSDSSATTYYIKSTDTWYSYVTASGSPFILSTTADSEDRYQVTTTADASTITAWIASVITENDITTSITGSGNGASLKVDVGSAGYYYIDTLIGTNVTLDTANPTATVVDKNTTSGNLKKEATDETVQIGDTVSYTITADVPLHDDGELVTEYTITDELGAGLSLDTNSVTITIYEADGTTVFDTNSISASSVTTSGFTVTFNPSAIEDYPENATIKITYTATVLNTATNDNMTNSASFGNDTETVDLKTFDFDVYKYTGTLKENTEEALEGAEFELYEVVNEEQSTTPISFVAVYNTTGETPVLTGYRVATSDDIDTTTTIVAGSVNIYGLDVGTYNLVETKAPDGYNLLEDATKIVIDEEGNVTVNNSESDGIANIQNNAGSELPSTGGIGTTIFYVVGTIMVLGAVVVLITRRRMSAE